MFGASAYSAANFRSGSERDRQVAGIVGFNRAQLFRGKHDIYLFRLTSDMLSRASSKWSDSPILFISDSQDSRDLLWICRLHNNAWNDTINRIFLQRSFFREN
jgi:hypothetical protein